MPGPDRLPIPGEAHRRVSEVPGQWKEYIEMNADYYRMDREKFAEKWGHQP